MERYLVLYLCAVSIMKVGAMIFAFFEGYDSGTKGTRTTVRGPGDDITAAIFNALIAALCAWALIA